MKQLPGDRVLAALFLVLAVASPCSRTSAQKARAQETRRAAAPGHLRVFKTAEHSPEPVPPYVYSFSVGGDQFTVRGYGDVTKTSPGSPDRTFKLEMDEESEIERLYYLEDEGALFFIYEMSDGESGWGNVAGFDRATLRPRWRAHIPGFNIGEALVEGNFIYLTAIGFIARLDLRTGKYSWKHRGLYERNHAFNNFELPRIEGDEVIFSGAGDRGTGPPSIVVNKRSGKILGYR